MNTSSDHASATMFVAVVPVLQIRVARTGNAIPAATWIVAVVPPLVVTRTAPLVATLIARLTSARSALSLGVTSIARMAGLSNPVMNCAKASAILLCSSVSSERGAGQWPITFAHGASANLIKYMKDHRTVAAYGGLFGNLTELRQTIDKHVAYREQHRYSQYQPDGL